QVAAVDRGTRPPHPCLLARRRPRDRARPKMNFVALRMLTGDRGKYLGLVFAIACSTFLLENQTSIFIGILKRTGARIADVTDAEVWVMDAETQYFEETKELKDTDRISVRDVNGH